MKKIIYYFSIAAALFLLAYAYLLALNEITEFELALFTLAAFFLLVFGAYGLYAERLWKRFRQQGKTENYCVEANFYVQKMGLPAKVLLFPFMKVKSSNSTVIALLGAIAWVIILLIALKAFVL